MKRFAFKLQPLLNYRQYLERLAQQDTARVHMDVKNCESRILELEQAYDDQFAAIEKKLEHTMAAGEFQSYRDYLGSVENQIADENKKKTELKKVLKEKVEHLKKKSVEKKAMELYRERLSSAYQQEVIKVEQKELDEISSIKSARERANGTV